MLGSDCMLTGLAWIQLHWGKKGHTPAAFEVDQACTEAQASKSFTTKSGPFPCQGPPELILFGSFSAAFRVTYPFPVATFGASDKLIAH